MRSNSHTLRRMRHCRKLLILLLMSFPAIFGYAQQVVTLTADSTKIIQIVQARSLRQKTIDSATVLQTLAGNAIVRQGNTILHGDSIVLNQLTGIAEVFGNVHINDADTVHTYAQYLKYIGAEQVAYLKKSVRLTDGKATLTTEDLTYNIQTGIANYQEGGKVVNGKTVLTSRSATYYSDSRDVFFKENVHLVDPKYDMRADSLRYNTYVKEAYFISPTHIVSDDGVLDTRSGTYNLETGEAVFLDKTVFRDSTRMMTGGKMAVDDKTGIIQIEDNGKLVDSVNKVIVLGNQILLDKKKNSFLASRKPVMIIYRDNDSTYISADTLFSGMRLYDSSLNKTVLVNDTLKETKAMGTSAKDSIRYFLAFHHVRIFNDSLQAACDSLYYSTEDSVFRMYREPIFWSNKSQVTGDTIYMFTEKQQPKMLKVFYNGMVINQTNQGLFNQIGGRTIHAYFKEGQMDYTRVKGSPAESIFYPQDDDSAYVGMNRSKGDVIDIFFVNKELNRIKLLNNVEGTLFPMRKIPADQKYLKNFQWQEKRRPKHKLELFE